MFLKQWWSDSHLQEGFFEISSHRHGVKCPLTNALQSFFCSREPVFRHSFWDVAPFQARAEALYTIFNVVLSAFSSTTPLWKISNSLPSTVSAARSTIPAFNCSWITALHSSILFDFSSSEKGLLVFVGYARRLSESRLVALISLPGKVILQPSFV